MQTAISTVPGGLETPDFLQLRKDAGPAESEVPATPVPRELYQVIPERQTSSRGFMGSSTTYDVGSLGGGPSSGPRVLGQDDRGTKVRNPVDSLVRAFGLTVWSLVFLRSARLESRLLSIRMTWRVYLKKSSEPDTTRANHSLAESTYRVRTWIGESLMM